MSDNTPSAENEKGPHCGPLFLPHRACDYAFLYISAPDFLNSSDFSLMPFSAKSLTSCEIFIEQNCGPHMEQKWATLCASAGMVSSWKAIAFSGSRARAN